ncbi:MAG: hypothetical protein NTW20_00250 [Rhodobacterales bacterium]|nr:hypothetical protein [Rhodobacterales bacterium]
MISEIVSGLAAANQAAQLLKELREIDRSVDEAAFKLKIAEITEALADAKIALSQARVDLSEKDNEISRLMSELEISRSGELCPKCRTGRMTLTKSSRMAMGGLGAYGVEERYYVCRNEDCDYETKLVHDPQGLVPKFIAKR